MLTKYCLVPNDNELQSGVDAAVIEALAQPWHALFAQCSTSHAKHLSNADQAGTSPLTQLPSAAAADGESSSTKFEGLSYVYGEVTFNSLARFICEFVPLSPKGMRFWDVGSGTGYVYLSGVGVQLSM